MDDIERTAEGLQVLEQRQLHKDMSKADKVLHPRCLMVLPNPDADADDPPRRQAIPWSDDLDRIAKFKARGYVVAEDPYTDPVESGKRPDVLVVKVPVKSIGAGGGGVSG